MQLTLQGAVTLIWILLSIFLCIGGIKLDVGLLGSPGPGLMPFMIGLFLGAVSIITLARTLIPPKDHLTDQKGTDPIRRGLGKQVLLIGALIGYAVLIEYTGFLLSTSVFMLFLFKAFEPQKWRTAITATAVTVAVTYYLFVIWLGCQFPSDLFR